MRDEEEKEPGGVRIPGFQAGGFVRETGIALVHQGEFVVPAQDSEAVIEPATMSEQGEVNYYFPVEVVLVGTLPEEEREAIEARIWERLYDELERLI